MSAVPSRHPKYRTKLCRNFVNGDCPFGDKCSFLHLLPGIVPPSSLAHHALYWNALLPQLFALSGQRRHRKEMPHASSPQFQEPLFIDEEPSPPTSLLLSMADGSSSEQISPIRRLSKRKRYPCRHFLRTGGWCPVGTECRFYHDVAMLPSAGVQKAEHSSPSETDMYGARGRTISGGVLMSRKATSPPIISQEYPGLPHYDEAEQVQSYWSPRHPYSSPTVLSDTPGQPTYLPSYTWQAYQPYYATVPTPVAEAPSSSMHQSGYPSAQAQPYTVSLSETQNSLPPGAYEVNGTTYFPPCPPSVPAPGPVTYSVPVHPTAYNHTRAPAYPCYEPCMLPASYYNISNQTTEGRLQTSFDPFGSDPIAFSELPAVPGLEDYQTLAIRRDIPSLPASSASGLNGNLMRTAAIDKSVVTQDHEFPYQPPKNRRGGHARRISINIKKHDRANGS